MSADGTTPRTDRRTGDRSWMLCTTGVLVLIWVVVLVVSIFAPDLVSGSQQEHIPLAAFSTWIFGAAGTAAVLWTLATLRGDASRQPIWVGYSILVSVVWLAAMILALTLPEFETGTDPTLIPFGAIFAPLGAAVVSGLAGVVAVVFGNGPKRDEPPRSPGPPT